MTMLNPRVNYEMTEDDLKALLDACRSVPCMAIGNVMPPSPQENANHAWAALGEKMGFDPMSVRPGNIGNQRAFTAVPSETTVQQEARVIREAGEKRYAEIARLTAEINKLTEQLNVIRGKE